MACKGHIMCGFFNLSELLGGKEIESVQSEDLLLEYWQRSNPVKEVGSGGGVEE